MLNKGYFVENLVVQNMMGSLTKEGKIVVFRAYLAGAVSCRHTRSGMVMEKYLIISMSRVRFLLSRKVY